MVVENNDELFCGDTDAAIAEAESELEQGGQLVEARKALEDLRKRSAI